MEIPDRFQPFGVMRRAAAVVVASTFLLHPVGHAANCTASVADLSFGVFDTINNLDSTTSITVDCRRTGSASELVVFRIDLSSGPGTYTARQMNGPTDVLLYNLYSNTARTSIWGDGSGGTNRVFGFLITQAPPGNSPVTSVQTVYGRIPGMQHVGPGAYVTIAPITVTVTY